MIGECKSLAALSLDQKEAIRQLGEQTGAYLAFCTLADTFSADDKLFFEGLVVAGQKPILLSRKHLERSYMDTDIYGHEQRWLGRSADLISRLTVKEVLGDEFAKKHGLHL